MKKVAYMANLDLLDPLNAPFASVKFFYRPRGGYFITFLQPS
jgi:hypothetical protein